MLSEVQINGFWDELEKIKTAAAVFMSPEEVEKRMMTAKATNYGTGGALLGAVGGGGLGLLAGRALGRGPEGGLIGSLAGNVIGAAAGWRHGKKKGRQQFNEFAAKSLPKDYRERSAAGRPYAVRVLPR